MGKRSRRRRRDGGDSAGPSSFAELGIDLDLDAADVGGDAEAAYDGADGERLVLRTAMTPGTRREYAAVAKGERGGAAATSEDAWQRAVEFLFERLAVRWEVAGVATTGQHELLARLRAATVAERRFVRDTLREHAAAHFPDVEAP